MYKNILVPIDVYDENSWMSHLPVALEMAKVFKSKLSIMTVVPDTGMALVTQYFSKDSAKKIVDETKEKLNRLVKEKVPEGIKVQYIVSTGNVYESIIKKAKEIDADLIVISASRPELKDYLLGPNAARVVRHSDRSVLVIRD